MPTNRKRTPRRRLRFDVLECRRLLSATTANDIAVREFVTPPDVVSDHEFEFEAVIEQLGSDPLASLRWQLHLSQDAELSDDDTKIGSGSSPHGGGQIASWRQTVRLQHQNVQPGFYHLIFEINPHPTVAENDYSNNTVRRLVRIVEQPLLRIDRFTATEEVRTGGDIRVDYRITNPSTDVRIERPRTVFRLIDATGEILNSWAFDFSNGAKSRGNISHSLTVPSHVPAGDHALSIDVSGASESYARLKVRVLENTDQIVTEFEAPAVHQLGEPIDLRVGVTSDETEHLSHSIYLSADPWLDPSDTLIDFFFGLYFGGTGEHEETLFFDEITESGDAFLIMQSRRWPHDINLPVDLDSDIANRVRPIRLLPANSPLRVHAPGVRVRNIEVRGSRMFAELLNTANSHESGRLYFYGSRTADVLSPDVALGWQHVNNLPARSVETYSLSLPGEAQVSPLTIFAVFSQSGEPPHVPEETPSQTHFFGVDLAITELVAPDLLTPTTPIHVTVENRSQFTSESRNYSAFLSPDGDTVFSRLPSVQVETPLGPGESETVSLMYEEKALMRSDFQLVVRVSNDEANPQDSIASTPIRLNAAQLDFEASNEIELTTGEIRFNLLATNGGTADAVVPSLRVYFGDADAPLDSTPTFQQLYRFSSVQTIAAGETERIPVTLFIRPEDAGRDVLLVRASLDDRDYQPIPLAAPIGSPDFATGGLSVHRTDDGYLVAWTVTNVGPTAVPRPVNEVAVTRSVEDPTSRYQLIQEPVDLDRLLLPGESYRPEIFVGAEELLRIGENYDGFLVVRSGDSDVDLNFTNNQLTFPINSGERPDLEILPVELPDRYGFEAPTPIKVELVNRGSSAIPPQEVRSRIYVTPTFADGSQDRRGTGVQVISITDTIAPGASSFHELEIPSLGGDLAYSAIESLLVEVETDDVRWGFKGENDRFEFLISDIDASAPDYLIDNVQLELVDPDHGIVEFSYDLANVGNLTRPLGRQLVFGVATHSPRHNLVDSQEIDLRELELAPGETRSYQHRYTVATETIPGMTASVRLEQRGTRFDGDWSNEAGETRLEIDGAMLPDPQAELLSVDPSGKVTLRIVNQGELPATKASVSFFYTLSDRWGRPVQFDRLEFDFSDNPILGAEVREWTTEITLPDQVLESYGRVYVSTAKAETIAVDSLLPPRLPFSLQSFWLPGEASPGQVVTAEYVVESFDEENQIEEWLLEIEIDGNVSTIPIHFDQPLISGNRRAGEVSIEMPAMGNPGGDPVIVRVRARRENEALELPFLEREVLVGDYELQIQDAVAPETAIAGQTTPVSWSAISQETLSLSHHRWTDAVYLSEDDVLDESDLLLLRTEQSSSDLTLDDAYSVSTEVSLPVSRAARNMHLIVRVDDQSERPDGTLTDNVLARQIFVSESRLFVDLTSESDTGISSTDNLTRARAPEFEFIVPGAGTLSVDFSDGRGIWEVTVAEPSRLTRGSSLSYPLDEGSHTISASFVPSPSESLPSQTAEIQITVDRTAPLRVSPEPLRSEGLRQIRFELSEPVFDAGDRGFAILEGDGLTTQYPKLRQPTESSAQFEFSSLFLPGDYALESTLTDRAGNLLRASELTFEVVSTECTAGNPVNPLDVNFDGIVSPRDALLVINAIAQVRNFDREIASPRFAIDVDCNNSLSPRDVLRIINHLDRSPLEGERFPSEFGNALTTPADSSEVDSVGLPTLPAEADFDNAQLASMPVEAATASPASVAPIPNAQATPSPISPAAVDDWLTLLDQDSG